ncbi:MAG: hypothetical protein LW823_06255 [Rickettsiales bacterium]|jgi:cell division transport system permease protein|nr:hypothetical protein [Rickettsiales bacterium]
MFTRHSDIHFAGDDSHRFLPWIMGIMIFMAAFLLCVGISVGQWVSARNDVLSDRFTVNIPASTEDLADKTKRIEDELMKLDQVQSVKRLSDDEMNELLKPWLGDVARSDKLPVPMVVEVDLMPDAATRLDYKAIQHNLRTIAAGVEVDAQELWVQAFARFSGAIQQIVTVFASLIVSGLAMMIAFTSRAALKLHAKTVQLLHSVGAEDRYVTRQFQFESLRLTLPGALFGTLAAAIAFIGLCFFIASLDSAMMPALRFGASHALLLIAMPVLCLALSWGVARFTVMHQLERSL